MRTYQLHINSKSFGDQTIIVDLSDFDLVNRHKWYIIKDHNKLYAASWERLPGTVRKYRPIRLHRYILGETNPKVHIDHRDGNGLNNSRSNLRLATCSQNGMNRGKDYNSTSGFKGVSYKKSHKKYSTYIVANGKTFFGGHFDTAVEAAKKYNELAKQHHGEFAYQNQV